MEFPAVTGERRQAMPIRDPQILDELVASRLFEQQVEQVDTEAFPPPSDFREEAFPEEETEQTREDKPC
jgi:hypothetical protein